MRTEGEMYLRSDCSVCEDMVAFHFHRNALYTAKRCNIAARYKRWKVTTLDGHFYVERA